MKGAECGPSIFTAKLFEVECGRESESDWKKLRTEPGMSRARGYSGKNVPEFSTFKIPILLSDNSLLIESNL